MASKSNERFRYGMCLNDECPCCKEKKLQQISMRKDFVCEECGKELREARPPKRKPKWPIFVGIGAVAVVIIVLCVVLIPGGDRSEVVESTPVENTDSMAAEAAEQARLDSIKALEEAAEAARLAEEAAAAAEQARLDSIKAAEEAAKSVKKVSKGSLDYGKWSGAWKNGQPNGTGTMTYTKEHLIDSRDPKKRVAQPGDYIIGEFSNGRLVQGKWFDASNNVKGSIIIGK